MSQHDMTTDNDNGANFRADVNSGLQALVSLSSGATEPATKFAYMLWADTTTGLLKIRNAANNAWIIVCPLVGGIKADTGQQLLLDDSITAAGAALPLAFDGDPDTGLVRTAANTMQAVAGGAACMTFHNTGGVSIARASVTAPAATDGNVCSGTYTPTLTNTTNVASSAAVTCQYMRVGNVVTVSGQFTVQATTAGTLFTLGMSLPVASNFTLQREAGGSFSASSDALTANMIAADATNDRLLINGIMTDTISRVCAFHATYQVI